MSVPAEARVERPRRTPTTLADDGRRATLLDRLAEPRRPRARSRTSALTGGTIADGAPPRIADAAAGLRESTGRGWSSGGATSASSPPDTRRPQRPPGPARPARRASASTRPTCTRCLDGRRGRRRRGRARRRTADDAARATAPATFDVLMLGIGPDGHCASLFPGHPALDVDDAIAVAVLDSPKPPPERVTLTLRRRSTAPRAVWFLACGRGARPRPSPGCRATSTDPAAASRQHETLWAATSPLVRDGPAADLDAPVRSRCAARPRVRERPPTDEPLAAARTCVSRARRRRARSEDDLAGLAAGAQQLERLVEDVLGLRVGATLLHVGEVRLVGLDLRRRRRVVRVEAGRAARTAGSPTTPGPSPRPRTSPRSGARASRSR